MCLNDFLICSLCLFIFAPWTAIRQYAAHTSTKRQPTSQTDRQTDICNTRNHTLVFASFERSTKTKSKRVSLANKNDFFCT